MRRSIGDAVLAVVLIPVALVGVSLAFLLISGYFPIWLLRRGVDLRVRLFVAAAGFAAAAQCSLLHLMGHLAAG